MTINKEPINSNGTASVMPSRIATKPLLFPNLMATGINFSCKNLSIFTISFGYNILLNSRQKPTLSRFLIIF